MIELNIQRMNLDVKKLRAASKELNDLLMGEETMLAAANEALTIVKKRTLEGVDAGGEYFDAYSDEYAKRKAKSGRSIKPNLSWSGRMLNNMAVSFVSMGKARIIFTRSEEADKASYNYEKRQFFDIRLDSEIARVLGVLEKRVARIQKQLGLA